MKKILLGVLAVALTVGLVGGAAYAVFTDLAQVKGIAISAGNANLEIWDGDSYEDDWVSAFTWDNIYPGWERGEAFALQNVSDSDIELDVTAQLTGYVALSGNNIDDWNVLKNQIEIRVMEYTTWQDALNAEGDEYDYTNHANNYTDWLTLEEWQTTRGIVNNIAKGNAGRRYFVIWARVKTTANNNIANAELNDVVFDLVGTQVL